MQTMKKTALAVLMLLMAVAAVGCVKDAAGWPEATSASGNYVVQFPHEPTTESMKIPNTELSMQLTQSEDDSGYYALAETDLNGVAPNPLDFAVDSSIQGARAKMATKASGPVTATEISRTTGDFVGVETRQFRVKLTGDGMEYALNGLVFYRDDAIVNAIVVTDADAEPGLAERFLSSLKSKPDPDLKASAQRLLEVGD